VCQIIPLYLSEKPQKTTWRTRPDCCSTIAAFTFFPQRFLTFPHVSSRFLNDFSQASTGLFFPTGRNMPTKRTAKSGTLCNEGERKIAKKRGKWTKIKIRDRAT
jgi:hypothetical protein